MNLENIKKYFKICTSCKGKKYEWRESHDCWGRDDSYQVSCYMCGGAGFILDRDLKKQVQKVLDIR